MSTDAVAEKRAHCPACGRNAKRVGVLTLAALLRDDDAQQFKMDGHTGCHAYGEGCTSVKGESGWRFCESPDCDVVYFSEQGDTSFSKAQLNVPVGVKETSGDRPLCYCFGHSVASIKDELRRQGSSAALEDIRAKMKDPGCRCETENPSGSCCLGSVGKGIKTAQEELNMDDSNMETVPTALRSSGNKGERIAKIGTVVSAIMASSCCWLPLVLLAVGVSGAGIASALEEYRPLFMVVTFGFLAAAFYFTYRPKQAAVTEGGHDCCATETAAVDDCCAPNNQGRFNMVTMNKVMLWGVTVMAVAFLLFPTYVGALLGGDGKTVTENMNRSVIQVEGMTCEGCSATVATAIRGVPSVLAVEVSYEKGEAIVGTEICCPVPQQELLAALTAAGYSGRLVDSNETLAQVKASIQAGETDADKAERKN